VSVEAQLAFERGDYAAARRLVVEGSGDEAAVAAARQMRRRLRFDPWVWWFALAGAALLLVEAVTTIR